MEEKMKNKNMVKYSTRWQNFNEQSNSDSKASMSAGNVKMASK